MSEHHSEKQSTKQSTEQSTGQDELQRRISDLEFQISQQRAGMPLGTLPWNGGGIEDEIAETWSQHDQELANAGEHPDQ